MNLEQFASKHRLKTRRSPEDDGELVVNGKKGQIYQYSESELAVAFTPGLDKNRFGQGSWCPKKWGNLCREALAAGMTIRQNGDSEGALSFDPANADLARLAIKISGSKVKRQLSADQIARLTATLRSGREKATEERHLSA